MSQDKAATTTPKTTGHNWDGIEEYTNPLPTWWIWGFYITFIFTVVYWLLYPAWPIGDKFTKGIPGLHTITYTAKTADGKEVEKTTHWNMRAKFMHEMNEHQADQKQWFDKVAATSFEDVSADAELMQFVNSAGKTLFSDNCAPCHQAGGQGKIGMAPNLTDDHWQFGGTYDEIHETIAEGRNGVMPPFQDTLEDDQITQLAHYVLSLSGEPHNPALAATGKTLFTGAGICFTCHGPDAKGNTAMGSANLTDKIWLWADIVGTTGQEAKVAEVKRIIAGGVNRGVMPTWEGRLKPEQIKLLTVYVHDTLGGGR
ncbi:cytochrome-c oxidase, cbb3-type subunit III [Methylobacillus arboreus]|uniref:cytochrome-c oxidase, cbb3-type subunit III n=1 Tax=Methylobacillus arboreus TaxID=755170 RepID=UPI001E48A22A|nr:cytochrome-c oxidase, cbb3-type subunit III [Methylobacillus arboreus]MCB5191417.1 cytochrome-c oxidase, cbb3-type subunit III [Methylobacillus arboreus]